MQLPLNDLVRYAFCDPGGSHKTIKDKGQLARSAIIVIGIDPLLNRIFVLDTWATRCTTDQLINAVFDKNRQWKPRQFGCEANAMQVHLGNAINREARFKSERLTILPINQPTRVDKEWRIESVLTPVIATGRLFVMESQVELITEMRGFPTAQTKDLVDALASAITMIPQRSVKRMKSETEESLARYLRNSGAAPDYIKERIASARHDARVDELKEEHDGSTRTTHQFRTRT